MRPKVSAPVWVATAIVATALIPLLVVGVIGYRAAASSLRHDTTTRLHDAAQSSGDQIDRLLFERYGDVQAFAHGKRAQSMQPAAVRDLMNTLLQNYRPMYAETVVADRTGRVIAARPASASALVGADVAAQPWFRAAKHEQVAVEQTPSHAVTFSTTIRRDGRTVGVWENVVSWRVIEQILHDAVADARAPGMHLFLLDARRRRVASDDPNARVGGGNLVQRVREPGYSTYRGLGWTVVAVQSKNLALAAAAKLGRRTWLLGAISVVLVLAAAFFSAAVVRRAERARDRLETSMRHSYKLQAVGQLAGGVAHDFNNLLTVITGNAELARTADLPEPVSQSIDQIAYASDRASTLVRHLMTFSRTHEPEVRVVDLNSEVAGIVKLLPRLIEARVEIESTFSPEPAWVHVDPVELEQVLLNLAINARDAMPDGGVLSIATTKTATSAQLSVADTGVGMDAPTVERIFEPFYTTKAVGSGTGLGLSTVYGTVTAAGGTIQVHSTPGEGTTFAIDLPLAELSTPAVADRGETGAADGRGERVLVVEDEELVRAFTSSMLSRAGCHITSASNGEAALEQLERETFDLVVSDIVMPRKTGLQLLTMMRSRGIDTPVLLVSGYVQGDDVVRDKRARIVAKPFTPNEIAAAMNDLLR